MVLFPISVFIGAVTALAPEKEWINLNVGDLTFLRDGRCEIYTYRPKVDDFSRIITIESKYASSNNSKSLRFYLDFIRPKYAKDSETALLINPETGERWTRRQLYNFLKKYGEMVLPGFKPYDLRHWGLTARMIEWEKSQRSLQRVAQFAGHGENGENIDMTARYLHLADAKDDEEGSWLHRAFIHPNQLDGRQHVGAPVAQQKRKKALTEHKPIKKSKRVCRELNYSTGKIFRNRF